MTSTNDLRPLEMFMCHDCPMLRHERVRPIDWTWPMKSRTLYLVLTLCLYLQACA